MQEHSQPAVPQQLAWQYGNGFHPRRNGVHPLDCAGRHCLLAEKAHRYQRAEGWDERIWMKETIICEKNEAVTTNCYPWVSELAHHWNKWYSSLKSSCPALCRHTKNFYLQLTLRGLSSPQLPSSQFCWFLFKKGESKEWSFKKELYQHCPHCISSPALPCLHVSLDSRELSLSW